MNLPVSKNKRLYLYRLIPIGLGVLGATLFLKSYLANS
jgi:hypothetical protein